MGPTSLVARAMRCDPRPASKRRDGFFLTTRIGKIIFRFGRLLPSDSVNLDTRLNTELVHEVISVMHAYPDKKLDILVAMLLATAEDDPDQGGEAGGEGKDNDGGVPDDNAGRRGRRYLTLRSILRFSFQHPPLLFPVMQFQRILRSKILGEIEETRVV